MNRLSRYSLLALVPMLVFGPKWVSDSGNVFTSTVWLGVVFYLWVLAGLMTFMSRGKPVEHQTPNRLVWIVRIATIAVQALILLSTLGKLAQGGLEADQVLRSIQLLAYLSLIYVSESIIRRSPDSRKFVKQLINVTFITGVCEVIVAILYQQGFAPWVDTYYTHGNDFFRFQFVGTFSGEHNTFALMVMFVLSLALAQWSTAKKNRLLSGGLIAMFIVAVLGSQSRSGYVTLAAMLFFWLLLSIRSQSVGRILFALVFAGIILWFAKDTPLILSVLNRITSVDRYYDSTTGAFILPGRTDNWGTLIQQQMQNLDTQLFGEGFGSYRLADNMFVKILVETGVLGLGAYLLALAGIGYYCFVNYIRSTTDKLMRMLALSGLLCLVVFLIMSLSIDALMTSTAMAYAYIQWAMLASLHNKQVEAKTSPSQPNPTTIAPAKQKSSFYA